MITNHARRVTKVILAIVAFASTILAGAALIDWIQGRL